MKKLANKSTGGRMEMMLKMESRERERECGRWSTVEDGRWRAERKNGKKRRRKKWRN
jgi:hypothetical protein